MKSVLARFYFVYVLLLFFISSVIVWLVLILAKPIVSKKRYPAFLHKVFQIWMGIYMPLVFCPVRHYGRDKFKKGENYVVVINHNAYADIPVSAPGIPGANRTLAKIELSKVPFFGYIYRQGSILVDRKSRKSRYESFEKMKNVLRQGMHLCLYPEGTRNKTDELLAGFKDGAFKVAIEEQKDVLPGIILGTKNILDLSKFMYAWPNKIEFHFLDKIPVGGLNIQDIPTLKEETRSIMLSFLEEHKERLR